MLLIFSLIFCISIVSAAQKFIYNCTNGSELIENTKEIDLYDRKSVNGIGIGVTNADEISALARFIAEVIVDARQVELSNETISQIVNISGRIINVTLVNATDDSATIRIGQKNYYFNEKELTSAGNYEVFVYRANEAGGIMIAELLIGNDRIFFTSHDAATKEVTIDKIKYVIELFSASDNDATMIVRKCKTGDIQQFEYVPEETKNATINNGTVALNKTQNQTVTNKTKETEEFECDTEGKIENGKYCKGAKFYLQKEIGEMCKKDYECLTLKCKDKKCIKPSIFSRIWGWFKGLF